MLKDEAGRELLEMVFTYFQSHVPAKAEVIESIIENLEPKSKITAMTAFQDIYKKGKLEGKLEGQEEKSREFVTSLLLNTDWQVERIASVANVTAEFVHQIKTTLKKTH